MKLENIEFIKLLPQFMHKDGAVQGLSVAIDNIVKKAVAPIMRLSTWDCIDELSEAELDQLAWELNILWYDTGANIGIKRELVKNSDNVYRSLGTKWAVENVIQTYFGDGYIEEWFEYSGEPGHFRVYSSNPTLTQERLEAFLNLLSKVKRASAKLDEIIITLSGEMKLSAGMAVHDTGSECYGIGAIAN